MIIFKSLTQKTIAIIGVTLIILGTIAIFVLIRYQSNVILERTNMQVRQLAELQSSKIEHEFDLIIEKAKSQTIYFQNELGTQKISREQVDKLLYKIVKNDSTLYSSWLVFVKNCFDGRDSEFINTERYGKSGSYSCWWHQINSLQPRIEFLDNFEDEAWYIKISQSKLTTLTEPYPYFMDNGDTVVFITAGVPIILNEKIVGYSGAEVNSMGIEKIISNTSAFIENYTSLISPEGIYAYTQDKALIGKVMSFNSFSEVDYVNFNNGNEIKKIHNSSFLNKEVYDFFFPLKLKGTNKNWFIRISVPTDLISNQIRDDRNKLLIVFGVAFIFIIVIVFLVIYFSIKPITKISKNLIDLASKNIDNATRINVNSNTEIGVLSRSYNQLMESLIEKAKTENSLKESEGKYHLLSDLNHEGLAIHDKGVLLEANKAFYNIFGYSEKELSGKYAIDILFTEESIKILLIKMKQPSGEPYVVEGIHKSGRHLWVELEGRDFTFRGIPARFVLFRDITEKKKQEDIILESHKRFKRLTELSSEGIIIHKDGIAVDFNPAFERYMGSSREKLVGTNFYSFFNTKKSLDIIQTEMKKDYASPYEVEIRDENNKNITLQITSYFLSKEENLRVALVREITEEKEEEKRIMNAIIEAEEKERSYFSKELHDGLGPVLSSLNMYFEWLSDTDEVKEKELILKNGLENINEAVNIVDEISNRLTPRTLNSFGINAAIETFISRLQIGDTLQFNFSSNLTERLTMHREAAIYRVITELINNSMKHASAKNITIDISYKKTDNYLIILYLDDGVGFNFKKVLKKNEGFGLVNIMERVKTYNGNIKFTTAPGKGLKVEMNFYNAIQINED